MIKTKPLSPLLEYTATSSYASLQKATEAMCKHRSAQGNVGITFSLFETSSKDKGLDSGDWIVKHPNIWSDEPVFLGQVIFYSNYWRISDKQVNSEIMINPRWSEIICESNRQLIDPEEGDTACLFLEGFRVLDPRSDGVTFIELVWGS
jgi:hypothetical protein